jgi:hypothetical protein
VRIFRAAQESGTMSSTISAAFRLSSICCWTPGMPRSLYSSHPEGSQSLASIELSTQSVMKLGCRSHNWYIINQKQDMIANQAISLMSKMLTIVRTRTANGLSVLSAPEGTSLKVRSRNRLQAVNPAQA